MRRAVIVARRLLAGAMQGVRRRLAGCRHFLFSSFFSSHGAWAPTFRTRKINTATITYRVVMLNCGMYTPQSLYSGARCEMLFITWPGMILSAKLHESIRKFEKKAPIHWWGKIYISMGVFCSNTQTKKKNGSEQEGMKKTFGAGSTSQ